MFGEYVRRLRQSGSMGEAEVMLVEFRMRNGFRERLVIGLKERGYHGRKAGGRANRGEAGRRDVAGAGRPHRVSGEIQNARYVFG